MYAIETYLGSNVVKLIFVILVQCKKNLFSADGLFNQFYTFNITHFKCVIF